MARFIVTALTIALLAVPLIGAPATAGTLPKCNGLTATIVGDDGPDYIRGTSKRDVIVTKGGRDIVYGRGGNDVICAGKGKDLIFGGGGNDRVFGGAKNDKLVGGGGYDRLNGGTGRDACYVGAGGGAKVSCETNKADIDLWVRAPEYVDVGEEFDIWVHVENIGAKKATGVEVVIDYDETNVTCRMPMDPSGTYHPRQGKGVMVPTAYWDRVYTQHCQVPIASTASVAITVKASAGVPEDTLLNNEASKTIEVIAP